MSIVKKFEPIDYSAKPAIRTKDGKSQTLFLSIEADYSVSAVKYASGRVGKFIHVDLRNSRVGPGSLAYDQDDRRGYFLDQVTAEIWFQSTADRNWDPANRFVDMHIQGDAPEGAPNSAGNISSSMSFSLSGSAGSFGEVPTANVGGGVSIGSSYSHQITDFTFFNHSQGDYLKHVYRMTQSGSGQPYDISKPGDAFIDTGQSPFVGVRLASIPSLAKSNFPLASQVIWMPKLGSSMVDQSVVLLIKLTGHYQDVEGTNNGFTIDWENKWKTQWVGFKQTINLADTQP